ncbi:hypothetical protein D7Y15_23230 [Corallococcus sp. AB030]|nr:hypothetical protein D7Y15_23230 [Corallococcus sp. AB030]
MAKGRIELGNALTKPCQRCGEVKRLSEYYENRTKPDHRNGICKLCQAKVDEESRKRKKPNST